MSLVSLKGGFLDITLRDTLHGSGGQSHTSHLATLPVHGWLFWHLRDLRGTGKGGVQGRSGRGGQGAQGQELSERDTGKGDRSQQ